MRRALSPIALRLLLFNVLLVFLPVAGMLSLATLERQLLALQERSLVQQGRIAAAALGGSGVDVDPLRARELIQRLEQRSEARLRIVNREGRVVADSASSHPAAIETEESPYAASRPEARERPLYRIGALLWQMLEGALRLLRVDGVERVSVAGEVTPRDAVAKALAGRYGATVRVSAGQRSLTMYSVLPIRGDGDAVVGAVMVSQSTSRILRALWRVRLETFQVFAVSIAVAIVLSLLVSATIARPLIRLRDEADALLDHRGRLRRTFRGSKRRDEIGDLTRALAQLTARLERHLMFVESVSADVSHEFKNPLASIRNAAELLPLTESAQDREQLTATIEKEVARLTRLVNAVREVSRVDAAVDTESVAPVDLRSLLSELTRARPVDFAIPREPVFVTASEDRLVQAFSNVIDNAISFSPPHTRVQVAIEDADGQAIVRIDDCGPGIPSEHLERVFDRFFSYRPGGRDDPHDDPRDEKHDGLGLAIARAVVEGYGGSIRALNLQPTGTRVEVQLPVERGAKY